MKSFTVYFLYSIFHVVHAALDCSIYSNDLDMINMNPFYVRIGLLQGFSSVDYVAARSTVKQMIIANNQNPSTSLYCLKNLETLQLINTSLPLLPELAQLKNIVSFRIERDNGMVGEQFPSEIGQFTNLTSLTLIDIRNMKGLPKELEQLSSLQTLILSNIPNLEDIASESIGRLVKLQNLNLIDVPKVKALPYPMDNLQNLNSLIVTNTSLAKLQVQNLSSLATLQISKNSAITSVEIQFLPRLNTVEIKNNTALTTIALQDSAASSISIDNNDALTDILIENISTMTYFSLYSSLNLKTIGLTNIRSLNSLTFSSHPTLKSVTLNGLPALSTVSILNNPALNDVTFIDTPRIYQLDLSGCGLTTLPSTVLSLKSLNSLNLAGNQLSSLPSSLATELTNLAVLTLTNNRFTGNIFLPPLTSLTDFRLENNSLTALQGISGYTSLQKLYLDYNQIDAIPMEIMKLSPKLQFMAINSNQLTMIPYSMANMRSLNVLQATKNSIDQAEKLKLYRLFQGAPVNLQLY